MQYSILRRKYRDVQLGQHVDATVRSTDTKMHALSLSVDLDIQVVSELMNVTHDCFRKR